ncbi:uncharacterized protein LOC130689562 [Daphnia carinata]|uniref:uncharacterized protein LOC130689562 n=1 Tax=Daphnia carinata TaxID=120202 RepID=UPI00257B8C58|nr:uncharacterized protein LOC130689562 [Daphnia carinata]
MDRAASQGDENRLALKIKKQCSDMKNVNGMTVYKLPLKTMSKFSGASPIVQRFSFGEPNRSGNMTCKTILLMGATGSGKSTMINAMINYVLGVQWKDPFRFILVDEKETSQAFSQTREVTAYDIHYTNGFRIPHSLTIVDTPGFGDTGGIGRDQEITAAVKQFFEDKDGIQELDAVGFTVQSSQVRLTDTQQYIFSSVLSIFGKDIKENVRFLVTFSDGGQPPVLAAIKEAKLPCLLNSNGEPCHQSFNNRAIYVSNQTPGDRYAPIDWECAMENFQSFFADLSKMPIKSLQLTKEVMISREILHNTIASLETTIQAHLMKMEELRKIEETIALHKNHIDANKNFEMTVTVPKKKKVDVDDHLTAMNCRICEVTCQFPYNPKTWANVVNSLVRNDIKSAITSAVGAVLDFFSSETSCKFCPGRCHHESHSEESATWKYVQVEETRTLYEIRKKYDDAKEKTLNAEELKDALEGEVEQLKSDVIKAMNKIIQCSNELNKKALKTDPLTTPEYIKLLIENEQREKKPGYLERIKSLKDLLAKAKLMKDVLGGNLAKQFKKI